MEYQENASKFREQSLVDSITKKLDKESFSTSKKSKQERSFDFSAKKSTSDPVENYHDEQFMDKLIEKI